MFGQRSQKKWILGAVAIALTFSTIQTHAVLPGELIINEIYFDNYTKDRGPEHQEAVELLVVKDRLNLNGLLVSDRDHWSTPSEFQCTIQDHGRGFLRSVRAGTLVVIYGGEGKDDTDASDFTLTFYAQSSEFCNVDGKTNAFNLGNYGDNVHVVHRNKQVDFVKFRPNDRPERGGDPGGLEWDKGIEGFVDVGQYGENTGLRYLGDKPELNNFPVAWQVYPETQNENNNLGQPNGGRNTTWIEQLRSDSPSQTPPPPVKKKKKKPAPKPKSKKQ